MVYGFHLLVFQLYKILLELFSTIHVYTTLVTAPFLSLPTTPKGSNILYTKRTPKPPQSTSAGKSHVYFPLCWHCSRMPSCFPLIHTSPPMVMWVPQRHSSSSWLNWWRCPGAVADVQGQPLALTLLLLERYTSVALYSVACAWNFLGKRNVRSDALWCFGIVVAFSTKSATW